MVALDGETPSSLVVAIEPILGTIKYEARSHYHQVLEDLLHIKSLFTSVRVIMMVTCSSSRKWGVTRFQQV